MNFYVALCLLDSKQIDKRIYVLLSACCGKNDKLSLMQNNIIEGLKISLWQ